MTGLNRRDVHFLFALADIQRNGILDLYTASLRRILVDNRTGRRFIPFFLPIDGVIFDILRVVGDILIHLPNKIIHCNIFASLILRFAQPQHQRHNTENERNQHKRTGNCRQNRQNRRAFAFFFLVLNIGRFLDRFPFDAGDRLDKTGRRFVYKIFIFKMNARIAFELVDVVQHFGRRLIPACRILLHGLDRDVLQSLRDLRIDLPRMLRLRLQLHYRDGNRVIGFKGQLTGEHLIEHDTDGINIRLFVRDFAACLLGTDIMHRTDRFVRCAGQPRIRSRKTCNAEIRHFDGAIRKQHNILRLDVAMYDSFVMGVLQGAQDLHGEMHRFFPTNILLLVDVLLERNTVDVFHHDILQPFTEADIIHLHNIRMRQDGDGLGFIFKTAGKFLVRQILFL